MPSHIFLPLGLWDDAARSDEAAFEASVQRVARKKLSLAQQDFHSLGWLQYEYLQQGRFLKAHDLLQPVQRALATQTQAPGAHHVESEIGRGFGTMSLRSELASMRARLVVESGDWGQMKGLGSFDNIDELYALGASSVKLGDLPRADAARDHLETASRTVPDPDVRQIAAIMLAELTGMIFHARGRTGDAIAALAEAVTLEARRPRPIARPYPIKPAAELYGELLLALARPAEAVQQFEAALARTPRRAASLMGLARAARAAGQGDRSRAAAKEFLAIWHLADAKRPEIAEAKNLAAP
jgi:tetratricopeptide (TPR) repeat protein